ncbi:MAG: NUDIX domain-containing protein [Candidatus Pacearchaeota archaeon]|nr:NUDIX domain-containing protein [Candidatus Pacearchaeota archaeon]
MEEEKPGVCMAVLIVDGKKVLIGKRKNSRGEGLYAFPGGNLEFKEDYQNCVRREIKEECGGDLEVELIDDKFPFAAVPNEMLGKGHYVVLFVRAKYIRGTPKNMEPNKNEGWEWHSWYNLPQPLFRGIQYLVDNKRDPIKESAFK